MVYKDQEAQCVRVFVYATCVFVCTQEMVDAVCAAKCENSFAIPRGVVLHRKGGGGGSV